MIAKRTWQTILSVLGASIVVYFIYHTIQGDHGWLAMLRLENELKVSQDDLSHMQNHVQELERRVHELRSDSIDPDLLDEQARKDLNYSKPNEIIILKTPEQKK